MPGLYPRRLKCASFGPVACGSGVARRSLKPFLATRYNYSERASEPAVLRGDRRREMGDRAIPAPRAHVLTTWARSSIRAAAPWRQVLARTRPQPPPLLLPCLPEPQGHGRVGSLEESQGRWPHAGSHRSRRVGGPGDDRCADRHEVRLRNCRSQLRSRDLHHGSLPLARGSRAHRPEKSSRGRTGAYWARKPRTQAHARAYTVGNCPRLRERRRTMARESRIAASGAHARACTRRQRAAPRARARDARDASTGSRGRARHARCANTSSEARTSPEPRSAAACRRQDFALITQQEGAQGPWRGRRRDARISEAPGFMRPAAPWQLPPCRRPPRHAQAPRRCGPIRRASTARRARPPCGPR